MHARWLVEIATLFVMQSKLNEQNPLGLISSASHRYWTTSRQRFERWQELLTQHREKLDVEAQANAWRSGNRFDR